MLKPWVDMTDQEKEQDLADNMLAWAVKRNNTYRKYTRMMGGADPEMVLSLVQYKEAKLKHLLGAPVDV